VSGRIAVGGDGGWDYATTDVASRRLFVSHGEKVVVVNVDRRAVVGQMPATPGVHGIAFYAIGIWRRSLRKLAALRPLAQAKKIEFQFAAATGPVWVKGNKP
jgi:hypothetical protein